MLRKITREVLESYLLCKTKAHLKLAAQFGSVSEYERLLVANRQKVRLRAIGRILEKHADDQVARDIPLTTAALRAGSSFILDAILEDDIYSLVFDGLKRVDEPSKLANFHYIPVLFQEGRKVGKEQRLLLEVYGLLLSRLQGQMPSNGIVFHGNECRATRVRLNADLRKIERLIREVKEFLSSESPIRLILNNHCQICEFRQRCHDRAMQEDSISLLRGVGEKEIKNYARKGIFTITQLAHTFRPRRRGRRAPPKQNHRYHALQALALRDKRTYVFGTPQLPNAPVHVYLDIEGNPEERFDYLVGLVVVEGDNEQRYSFWADDMEQEEQIFNQFLETVTPYQDFVVFAYGSYEREFLNKMRKRLKSTAPVDRVLNVLVNLLSLIYSHVYFPTYSNGLKDVGAYLGCSWSERAASGIQSLVWRRCWEETHAELWKQKLITYNLDDCLALRRVTEFLFARCVRPETATGSPVATRNGPVVAWVEEIDRLGAVKMRGRKEFFSSDFAYINTCASFDYQRRRVYIRTSRSRKKSRRGPRKCRNRKIRVSQRVQIISRKCPRCRSTDLTRWAKGKRAAGLKPGHKRAFDLVFSTGGIKRKVIECRTSVHECLDCGETFIPERYERLAKHFHGLMSWAMHEHVAHRTSCPVVSEMLKDFFGLAVYTAEIWRFKAIMARYYRATYERLLYKILSSEVLQIDETEVRLRTGTAYVWVFTTCEEVVYVLRPTREGDFLHELLKEFKGVLVTDFYGAYDSIDCPQQKCLIHLMRDMNQDLLNNPFDKELQSITEPFGTLLRQIVGTIDQHGLRRRYLLKHESDVAKYFAPLLLQSYQSEAAEALRARLVKYRDKLFTFIEHDGVPWNNNNAENAIRRFGYYREDNAGRLREEGLRNYLVLLSICHTCHYKGVSFLKFLLSRQRDIDAFSVRPRRRLRSPSIETYPKGIVRPDFGGRRTSGNPTPNMPTS